MRNKDEDDDSDLSDEFERICLREIPDGKRREESDESDEPDRIELDERRPEGGLLDDICKQHISKVSMHTT